MTLMQYMGTSLVVSHVSYRRVASDRLMPHPASWMTGQEPSFAFFVSTVSKQRSVETGFIIHAVEHTSFTRTKAIFRRKP